MRGSKPGERRGGRQKGTPNKVTADIKALCQEHTPSMIKELARLALKAQSEQARVAAIKELLDRGHGKSPQAITGANGGPFELCNVPITDENRIAALVSLMRKAEVR